MLTLVFAQLSHIYVHVHVHQRAFRAGTLFGIVVVSVRFLDFWVWLGRVFVGFDGSRYRAFWFLS